MTNPNLPPINSLPGLVVSLQTSVAGLTVRADNQDAQIQALKDRATALETWRTAATAQISGLSSSVTSLSSRVAALEAKVIPPDNSAQVAQLRTDLDALIARVASASRLQQHLADHAASGYDFRRAQTESPNQTPPAPANGYNDPGMPLPSTVTVARQSSE